jgi:hypothetical protein
LQSDNRRHDWQNADWDNLFFNPAPSTSDKIWGGVSRAQHCSPVAGALGCRTDSTGARKSESGCNRAKSNSSTCICTCTLIQIYKIWPPSDRPRNSSPLDPQRVACFVSCQHSGLGKDSISVSAETQANQNQALAKRPADFFRVPLSLSPTSKVKAPPDFLQAPCPRVVSRQSPVIPIPIQSSNRVPGPNTPENLPKLPY